MSGIYHMNGVPTAYSTIAEDVQKGRDAKISHLLAQVIILDMLLFIPCLKFSTAWAVIYLYYKMAFMEHC